MSDIVINNPGLCMSIRKNRICIQKEEKCIADVPIESVDRIKIIDNIRISKAVLDRCIEENIDVLFFDNRGRFTSRIQNISINRTDLLKKQIRLSNEMKFCVEISKEIISSKISNQITLLRKKKKSDTDILDKHINQMLKMKNKIEKCDSIEEIMGCEGIASREYFEAISKIVPEKFRFSGRNKRPPKDMFNSMLSMSYSLLFSEIHSFMENVGLNSYIGFIHSERRNHPALVSDFMEEWRAVICDSAVMNIVARNMIDEINFDVTEESVYLNKYGREIVISEFEKRMSSIHEYKGKKLEMRDIMISQIKTLKRAILNEDYSIYKSFKTR